VTGKVFCLSSVFAALLVFLPTAAYPETAAKKKTSSPLEIEAGSTSEQLTNDYDDWTSSYLNLSKKFGKGKTLYGSVRQTNRFSLIDDETRLGYYHPLGKKWTLHLEGATSSTHRVLARWSLFGGLIREFSGGWVVNFSLRKRVYTNSRINIGVASLERYFGNFHATYSFYQTSLEGDGSEQAHAARLNYYYTDRSRIGLAVSSGMELEDLGPVLGVLRSYVTNITLSGRHDISRNWGVGYSYSYLEQGISYIKRGLQIGVSFRF